MDMQSIISEYNELKDAFLIKKGKYENLLKNKERLLKLQDEKTHYLDVLEQSKLLIADSSQFAKEQVKVQLENLVTSGLQYVFGTNMRFEIDIVPGKNRTEAEFYVVTEENGEEIKSTPENSNGGGVVDIVCLILRIAMLQAYSDPQMHGPLVLDEPVKMVSSEYIDKVGEFLKQLNEYFGRQVIMSSHNTYLAEIGDKKYLVSKHGNKSVVTDIPAT